MPAAPEAIKHLRCRKILSAGNPPPKLFRRNWRHWQKRLPPKAMMANSSSAPYGGTVGSIRAKATGRRWKSSAKASAAKRSGTQLSAKYINTLPRSELWNGSATNPWYATTPAKLSISAKIMCSTLSNPAKL